MSKLKTEESLSSNQRRVEIARVLIQNGWDALIQQLGLFDWLPGQMQQKFIGRFKSEKELSEDTPVLPVPRAFRETLETLGPTFIKLGQILSTRPDLLPESYIEELKKLQSDVPAAPWAEVENLILQEWNQKQDLLKSQNPDKNISQAQSVKDIFIDFNNEPLAAGSLGLAYRAKILVGPKEKDVIVKVQRPGIVPIVEADIRLLREFVGLLNKTRWGKAYNFMEMVDEFASVLRGEMDFFQEAQNTENIGENLKKVYKNGEIQTPEIYWEYCNTRMMTMAFIRGESLTLFFNSEVENMIAQQTRETEQESSILNKERKRLAEIITNSFLQQIFIDGFFHADPHPGNMILVPDEKRAEMTVHLIDFGMVGRVDPRSRNLLIDFLLAIIKFDARRATERVMEFGKPPPDLDRHQFAQDLDHILRRTLGRPLREVRAGQILQDIIDMSLRYRVQLPGVLITLLRVLITIEGICRQLDRDYILIKAAEPFIVQAIKNQFLQTLSMRDLARLGLEVTNLLTILPRQLEDFTVNLNNGRVQTITEHKNLEGIEQAIRHLGNRIAAGLLVCGLCVGSALSLNSDSRQIFGIPLLSWGLFTLSTLLGLWLLNGINRKS